MWPYTVAVRVHGVGADGPQRIAREMARDCRLIDSVEATAGPEQWQTELRVVVHNDSLASAIVLSALRLRRACDVLRLDPDRVAVAAMKPGV